MLVTINLLAIVVSYALRNTGCTWIILTIVVIFFSGIAALYYTRSRPRLFVARTVESENKNSRIVPLTKDTIFRAEELSWEF